MDSIEDLIKKSKTGSKPTSATATSPAPQKATTSSQISSTAASSELENKMKQMERDQKERMAEVQARMLGLPYINLDSFPIAQDTLKIVDREKAEELQVIPFYHSSNEIRIAGVRPGTPNVLALVEELKADLNIPVKLHLVSQSSFDKAIKMYDTLPIIKKAKAGVEITEEDLKKYSADIRKIESLQAVIEKVNVTDLVTAVVAMGLQMRSSDIHVETEETDVKVRYRIDGVLHDAAAIPREKYKPLSNRIKLLSKLKLNVASTPQDGRFTIFLKEDKIDVRVSTLPTSFGESIVMRILKASAAGLNFEDLGLRGTSYKRLLTEISKPNGMIITTGPTGSGKTTTLYSVLMKLNDEETKIITLEDPIEYKLKGINQSQIDHSREYNFAGGLRAILRQDPDVVMVGEIRDFETADTAINAALTGHLVVSTLHTNSAAGALPRFLAMGVKPFLLSPALNAIIGQRLVRRVCQECKEPYEPNEAERAELEKVIPTIPQEDLGEHKGKTIDQLPFFKGGTCEACNGLGYKGRVGIYEIMVMSKALEELISSSEVSEYAIQEVATKEGMVTMVQDGLLKAMDGLTTIEEVFRVAKTL